MQELTAYPFSLLGKRQNNEDTFYPLTHTSTNTFFIVCDGVGGNSNGEIAARIIIDTVGKNIQQFTIAHILEALQVATTALEEYSSVNNTSPSMATTIVVAVCQMKEVIVAWCGDSRLYHIRNGQILYKTIDHSLVQQMVNTGIITEDQAVTHPKKNIILQSVHAKMNVRDVETTKLNNFESKDFLLLCTDGLLEVLSPTFIQQNFVNENTLENLQQQLIQLANNNTNDNCTWYLIQKN